MPMTLPANPPVPDVAFYIQDHLGNTRVVYKASVNCGNSSISYTLEAVIPKCRDYFPYGKILREYRNGNGEKYVSTHTSC